MKQVNQILIISVLFLASNALFAANIDEYLKDAESYLQKKDYRAALIQLKNAAKNDPDNIEARLGLGETYLKLNNGPAAEKEFRRAKKSGANDEDWMPGYADALLLQNRANDLINDVPVTDSMSDNLKVMILGRHGQAYLSLGEVDKALENFNQVIATDSKNVPALLGVARIAAAKKDYTVAQHKIDVVLGVEPKHSMALTLDAELSRFQQKWQAAKFKYKKAIENNPNNMAARFGYITVFLALEQFDEAEAEVNKAKKIDGKLPQINYLAALIAFQKKAYQQAEASLRQVLRVAEGHLPSLLLMGRIQYQLNRFEQAETHLSQVYHKAPQNLVAIKVLAATRLKLKNYDGALKILTHAEKLIEDDVEILSMLGMAYSQSGKLSKGTEYFERAAAISPDKANLKTQLGMSYLATGNMDHAIENLQEAMKLDHSFYRADVMLILAHLRNKEFDKSLTIAKDLAEKQPENPVPYNFMGAAYSGKNEMENARNAFQKALKIKPDFGSAEINLARLELLQGNQSKAEKHYKNVTQYDSDNIRAYLELAKLYLSKGDKEQSLNWVKKARNKKPKALQPVLVLNQFYLADRQPQKALDVVESILSEYPNSITLLGALAKTQVAVGKIDDAILTIEKLDELSPQNTTILFEKARLHLQNKDEVKAKSTLATILKIDDKHLQANATLAQLHIKDRNYDKANQIAKKLKTAYKDLPVGWVVEGDVFATKKNFTKAAASYKTALNKNGNNQVVFKLAKSYAAVEQPKKAEKVLTDWLAAHEKDVAAHIALGQFYQSNKNSEKTIGTYKKALSYAPNNLVILNNLAWELAEKEDAEAVKYAEKAYKLAPDNPSIADTYGWSLVKSGEAKKGLAILKEASVFAPHLLDIKYHIAYANYKQNNVEKARKELDRILATKEPFSERNSAKRLQKQLAQ